MLQHLKPELRCHSSCWINEPGASKHVPNKGMTPLTSPGSESLGEQDSGVWELREHLECRTQEFGAQRAPGVQDR